ncbi:hypothetical protein NQZ68_009271 [Dissostichus eleginoides]|nr:hypothetical protein NQZ68_009271 [Dissostichus eleginoides]
MVQLQPQQCQILATPDGIVISSVLGSVAAEGAEGTTGGEASDDSSPSPGKLPDREFDPACGGRRRSARPALGSGVPP